jgi:choline dehydrogenase
LDVTATLSRDAAVNGGECDYLVVGAGAAGCVVAARLAEQAGIRVALVEAGPPDRSIFFKIPALGFVVMSKDRYNWNFETEPVPGLNNRRLRIFAGKVLGGSSSINGLTYLRGHPLEYDLWRQMGCDGWGFEDVLPYFRRSEGSERGASRWHGESGPIKVRRSRPQAPICAAFLQATSEAGFRRIEDFNAGDITGFGYVDMNASPRGRRMSTAAAYLGAAAPKGLRIITGAQALRIVIEEGRAAGIEIMRAGRRQIIRASKEVILSAGAINSPKLLMLSGIGPAAELRRHGIEVACDSPNVGANFQNHSQYTMQYACSAPVTSYADVHPLAVARNILHYALTGRGVLAQTVFTVFGFLQTDPGLAMPDIQVAMSSAIAGNAAAPAAGRSKMPGPWAMLPRQHGFGLTLYQGTSYSRGRVRLRSADPLASPSIEPNYFSDPRDARILAQGLRTMRGIVAQPAIWRFIDKELTPGPAVPDEKLESEIRRNGGTVHHPCGTCAMGSQPASVVDPRLRVRGIGGLRVADASIMPVMLNATLHAPTIMVGEKAAAMILADRA